jgi:hypothetical protein
VTATRRPATTLALDLMGTLAPHGRARGDDGTVVREHCEAQDVPDTLV